LQIMHEQLQIVGWLVRWDLTELSTQFKPYRASKVELYYKY